MSHNTPAPWARTRGKCGSARRQLQNAKCKLQIANCCPAIPVSVPRPLSPRAGISLTEVLIAMGILTVGLLGVAAIFPVASFYMQKGEVADRGSAIAQAAFNEVVTGGSQPRAMADA